MGFSCRRPVVNAFWSARGFRWSIKNLFPTKLVGRGFLSSLIGCKPFGDRSRTGRGLIVNFVANSICRKSYSLMERAAFPGQKKMIAMQPTIFGIAEAFIPATLHLWPHRSYVIKRLPSALRTSAINRQPVDNQSANKCRIKIYWEFGSFGRQWMSEIAAFSWLPEVRDRSLPPCDWETVSDLSF